MIRLAGGVLIASLLAGCAGTPLGDAAPAAAATDTSGRWILAAPNAPTCGLNFGGLPGAQEGRVLPEGGCPGKFFTSRRWTLEQGALVINDDENQPLARLSFADGHYEGQATSGMPVTLTRQIIEPQESQ
ncbi:MAG TPA: AprI/Inh family metalloprotease inhibitor [Pseudolabrys sp.]|nr:AprI/Inh family metalloprotease inhibitor [Pseudolabrys sp.]